MRYKGLLWGMMLFGMMGMLSLVDGLGNRTLFAEQEVIADGFDVELDRLPDDLRRDARRLIKKMAEKNLAQLLLSYGEITKLGKKADRIHPMIFLGLICQEGRQDCLKKILSSNLRKHFIYGFRRTGFGDRMMAEKKADNLDRYIPGLAAWIHQDESTIEQMIEEEDWGMLLDLVADS